MNKQSLFRPNRMYRPSEKGQSMVFVTIAIVALVGLLALVLDGGFAYAARRSAQNAADAGALAGANVLCGLESGDPESKAWEYAVTRNGANDATIVVGTSSIQVTATVIHDSFFAGVLGKDQVTATAFAEAGCYNPCTGTGVLPIAWACSPPDLGGEYDPDAGCAIEYGTYNEAGPLYVVMDTIKVAADYLCQDPPNSGSPAGALDCDIDNDNEDELMGGGGRSWLDLTGGGGGEAELGDIIAGDLEVSLTIHTWVPPNDGAKAAAFMAAENRVGDVVLLPVFNDYTVKCNPEPISACDDQWHPDLDQVSGDGDQQDYYHIIYFSLFKITGVYKNPNCYGVCTARDYLVGLPNNVYELKANESTIEGYFIEGYDPGLGGKCQDDSGAVTIYLDH